MERDKIAYDIYMTLCDQHFMRNFGDVTRDVYINGKFKRITSYSPFDYSSKFYKYFFNQEESSDIMCQWIRTLTYEQFTRFLLCVTWDDMRNIDGLVDSLLNFHTKIKYPLGRIYGL